jgi:hypothetical protein
VAQAAAAAAAGRRARQGERARPRGRGRKAVLTQTRDLCWRPSLSGRGEHFVAALPGPCSPSAVRALSAEQRAASCAPPPPRRGIAQHRYKGHLSLLQCSTACRKGNEMGLAAKAVGGGSRRRGREGGGRAVCANAVPGAPTLAYAHTGSAQSVCVSCRVHAIAPVERAPRPWRRTRRTARTPAQW